jgi:hypothetical protein
MPEIQRLFCDALFCLPGAHPWDYTYHFLVNFVGLTIGYLTLTLFRCPKRVSIFLPILFLLILNVYKEYSDQWASDSPGDMLADTMGLALGCIFLSIHIFRHSTLSRS